VLSRGNGRRAFRRIEGDELASLVPAPAPAPAEAPPEASPADEPDAP
jgi:hypothetical protein